jgi:hypothetical protein
MVRQGRQDRPRKGMSPHRTLAPHPLETAPANSPNVAHPDAAVQRNLAKATASA